MMIRKIIEIDEFMKVAISKKYVAETLTFYYKI